MCLCLGLVEREVALSPSTRIVHLIQDLVTALICVIRTSYMGFPLYHLVFRRQLKKLKMKLGRFRKATVIDIQTTGKDMMSLPLYLRLPV